MEELTKFGHRAANIRNVSRHGFGCETLTHDTTHSRWLRLLFTREFTMEDAMVLWDGLFACDPSFDLAPWVCVAMLIRIRNQCKFDFPMSKTKC